MPEEGKKGTSCTSTISDSTGDSTIDRTGLGWDRTCDMIGDRVWNRNGERTSAVMMTGSVTRSGKRTSEIIGERTSDSIGDRIVLVKGTGEGLAIALVTGLVGIGKGIVT